MTGPAKPEGGNSNSWWPSDGAHGVVHLSTIGLLAFVWSEAPAAPAWLAWNLLVLGSLVLLRRRDAVLHRHSAAILRMAHTSLVIPVYFTQLGVLVPHVNPTPWEETLWALDKALCFGHSPLELIARLQHPLLTEVLQWVYDFYFFIPVILGAAVVKSGRTADLARMTFAVALCIYLSYVGYFLVPATGPNIDHYGLYEFGRPLEGLFLASELREVLFEIEKIKQNCFPSGHTAVSLLSLLLARRFVPRTVPILLPLVAALIFSTLYLRYHYVVDVLAGILLAVASDRAAMVVHESWERRNWGSHGDSDGTS